MKKILLISSIAALLATSSTYADNTDNATMSATGKIVAALAIAEDATTKLIMPDLTVPTGAEPVTTVKVGCAADGTATVAYGGNGGNPFANGVTGATAVDTTQSANVAGSVGTHAGTCGKFNVTGEGAYNFEISTAATTGATGGVTVTNVNCNGAADDTASTATLSGGALSIYCGATISAAVGATVGALSIADAGTITVTYD